MAAVNVEQGTEDHDWFGECRGLAWMILNIAEKYEQAHAAVTHHPPRRFEWFRRKSTLGGDSELLMAAIREAKRWVDGPLRDYVDVEFSRQASNDE